MSRTYKRTAKDDYKREIYVRSKRRADPDLRKLARALIEIAQAEAGAEQAHRTAQNADRDMRTNADTNPNTAATTTTASASSRSDASVTVAVDGGTSRGVRT
jgi:hypothetical protein